jgi:hypothetical protein
MSIGAPQYGGYNAQASTSAITLTAGDDMIQAIDPSGETTLNVVLPDLGSTGQGKAVIKNTADAGSETLNIQDAANANEVVGSPTQNESATCVFSEGAWVCVVGAAN